MYDSLNIYTQEQIIALGITSFILEGLAFVYIFQLFRRGEHPIKEGLIFGIVAFGILMGSVGVLAEAAKFASTSVNSFIILEGSFYLINGAILGTLVGIIYGKD